MTTDSLWALSNVSKHFPGVKALSDVSISLAAGRIHALVGENGCGKSTLIKLLAGVHTPDEGSVHRNGQPITFASPKDAREAGVATIYQERSLIPDLTVAENIVLGAYPARSGFVRLKAMRQKARAALDLVDIPIDLQALVGSLSIADQQVVEIAKAVSFDSSLLILDEPTTALSIPEVERLHQLIVRLAKAGKSILYVSHRLEELFDVSHETTVIRDGRVVKHFGDTVPSIGEAVEAMVGRSLNQFFTKQSHATHEVALEVTDIHSHHGVNGVSFTIRRGEVLGLAGVVGSGRTEIARAIYGVDHVQTGQVTLLGRDLHRTNPQKSIRRGIGYVPESRKTEGLFFNLRASQNMSVARMRKITNGPFLNLRAERAAGTALIADFKISAHADNVLVNQLSGGNQQKLVLARWVFAGSEVLVLDEPTQGIDVGAKQEVYRIINELTAQGVAVLLISSDLPELMAISDRLAVVRHGAVTKIIEAATVTEIELVELISGAEEKELAV